MKNTLILLLMTLVFTSCTDVFEMEVEKQKDALVVEGWVTDRAEGNYVRLYLTVPYFDQPEYTPVSRATVRLTDDAGNSEVLQESQPGRYEIRRMTGVPGRTYKLVIEAVQGAYEATATMQRLSWTLDSVTYEYREKGGMTSEAGFYPHLHGQELSGGGDFVRLKIFRNGEPLQSASEINLFSDEFVDGNYIRAARPFIREPFRQNDRLRYEMWSLTDEAYRFWTDIRTQLNNGGLFAAPGSNTRTNVIKKDPRAMDVVGYFGASQVRVFENVIE